MDGAMDSGGWGQFTQVIEVPRRDGGGLETIRGGPEGDVVVWPSNDEVI